jgi:hypothetical protein
MLRPTVILAILVILSSTHLRSKTRILLLSDRYRFVDFEHPL